MEMVFIIIILIMSVVIHEVSHGYAAALQGDPTARLQGRLTLNPLKHLDPIGSFLVPFITYQAGLMVGWAKPVPYNPYNLRNQKWGELIVAIAGPISNIILALVFGLLIRFAWMELPMSAVTLLQYIVFINLGLAVFNMIPIPPLDGSKVLYAFLPFRYNQYREQFERYSFIALLVFIFFFSKYLIIPISFLFTLITGLS